MRSKARYAVSDAIQMELFEERDPGGVFSDDLFLQRLILGHAFVVVDDRGCSRDSRDRILVGIVDAAHFRIGLASEEGIHDIGRIVVIHSPAGHKAVHLARVPQ